MSMVPPAPSPELTLPTQPWLLPGCFWALPGSFFSFFFPIFSPFFPIFFPIFPYFFPIFPLFFRRAAPWWAGGQPGGWHRCRLGLEHPCWDEIPAELESTPPTPYGNEENNPFLGEF